MAKALKVFVRTPYNYDADVVSRATGVAFERGSSKTVQSQAQDSDINVIVGRFLKTGVLPVHAIPPVFGDFTDVRDYRALNDKIVEARQLFQSLPAEIRRKFKDDPVVYVDFCSDPANIDELRKLGLAEAAIVADPLPDPKPA